MSFKLLRIEATVISSEQNEGRTEWNYPFSFEQESYGSDLLQTGFLMNDFWIAFKGVVIGLAIAAPVGPIGVLCMRQTLTYGWRVGMATGLGAASADACYGCVAALGLMVISQMLMDHQLGIRIFGGLFLAYLGGQSVLSVPASSVPSVLNEAENPEDREHSLSSQNSEIENPVPARSLWQSYSTTFVLTLTNPATIVMFLGIFSGQSRLAAADQSMLLVLGVFLGSSLWWLTLTTGVNLVRQRLSGPILRWINQGAGLVILGFGVAIVLQALLQRG
jgi:threonine/homoserine/homoserine lactone efflux protein